MVSWETGICNFVVLVLTPPLSNLPISISEMSVHQIRPWISHSFPLPSFSALHSPLLLSSLCFSHNPIMLNIFHSFVYSWITEIICITLGFVCEDQLVNCSFASARSFISMKTILFSPNFQCSLINFNIQGASIDNHFISLHSHHSLTPQPLENRLWRRERSIVFCDRISKLIQSLSTSHQPCLQITSHLLDQYLC